MKRPYERALKERRTFTKFPNETWKTVADVPPGVGVLDGGVLKQKGTKVEIDGTVDSDLFPLGDLTAGDKAPFDIVLCAGQSNMNGRTTLNPAKDTRTDYVWQFDCTPASGTYRTIIDGIDPMHMPDAVKTGLVGPSGFFGKTYQHATGRKVLLVPMAWGGTSIIGGTPRWDPDTTTGDLFNLAITNANLAIAQAQAIYPSSKFVGTIWFQGETDGDNAVATDVYSYYLKRIIKGFRSRITGAEDSWFVLSQMVPEAIATRAGYPAIDQAHKNVASTFTKTAIALTNDMTGYSNDNLHFNQGDGIRIDGTRLAEHVPTAIANNPTQPTLETATYNFENDTAGQYPLNITTNNATKAIDFIVVDSGAPTLTGNYLTMSGSNSVTYSCRLDNAPILADLSVQFRIDFASGYGRIGVVLRSGNGVVSGYDNFSTGYLFQVNKVGTLRIYRAAESAFVQLVSTSFTTTSYTYYRATAIGRFLRFEASADGINWINVIKTNDSGPAILTAGKVDIGVGFATSQNIAFIDDIQIVEANI